MTIDLQIGDNREVLLKYPDNHFDCVVTSPPYWNLRDYNTPSLIFDGKADCEHDWDADLIINRGHQDDKTTLVGTQTADITKSANNLGSFCQKCGAWKGHLGLEPTPEKFIRHLIDTFDIIKNKLKDTGNCFVNIGDTYATQTGKRSAQFGTDIEAGNNSIFTRNGPRLDIPEKCLCMIPQRFAWEMIQRGWILRNEIIWKKSNHMPEPVTDRLTKSHETIWHFVKQHKYYYDLDVIREPHAISSMKRYEQITPLKMGGNKYAAPETLRLYSGNEWKAKENIGKNPGDFFDIDIDDLTESEIKFALVDLITQWNNRHPEDWDLPKDVWSIPTQAYSEAHFATFPLKLIEKPILAGCPIDGWVLDPFAGSGTVGEFCNDNHRNAVLIELNEEYKPLIVDRANLKQIPLSKIFSYVK